MDSYSYSVLTPYARFTLPEELRKTLPYREWLNLRIGEWLKIVDPENPPSWRGLSYSGHDCFVGPLQIGTHRLCRHKLCWYEPGRAPKDLTTGRSFGYGIAFHDFEHPGSHTVEEIMIMADSFANFLISKDIPFVRYGRLYTDVSEHRTASRGM